MSDESDNEFVSAEPFDVLRDTKTDSLEIDEAQEPWLPKGDSSWFEPTEDGKFKGSSLIEPSGVSSILRTKDSNPDENKEE